MTNQSLSSAALRYAELGYPVFPCAPGGKTPITKHGFKDASTDPEQIEAWWTRNPNANIGISTAGLLVVDVDGDGNPWLADDPGKCEDLARGALSLTPGGGRHHVFRQPKDRTWGNTSGKLAPRVDTRGNGGYIVAPPSVVDGKPYSWAETFQLDMPPDELPEPPNWLVRLLDSQPPPTSAPVGNTIPEGQRDATLARLAGTMRRVGMGESEIAGALLRTNAERCSPPLPESEVERIVRSISRYEPDQVAVAVVEDHWGQDNPEPAEEDARKASDPGPLKPEMLRVPGFISEVMDYTLSTAPYPNPVMAFCGALSLQAFLAGRKVRDPADNRTNIYLLGLAHSAAGKDHPRKVNMRVANAIGLLSSLGDRFASGEGIQDALFITPNMLFQTDEIDGMLQQINKSQDARHENVMGTLLTMYSSANCVFPMRRKAGKESPGSIDQPCLTVFGTAIPNHYYQALSERMLTNGFFARMIVLECGKRSAGQEPRIEPIPPRVLEAAKWWNDFLPGTGNLGNWNPVPRIVPHTADCAAAFVETRLEVDDEYAKSEKAGDSVGTTLWGRVNENARKLALLYAISEDHLDPRIGKAAAEWAREFVMHATRRMLFMAGANVADSPFHAQCLKLLGKLREEPGHELPHSLLLKRMKMEAKSFCNLIETLQQQGDIEVVLVPRAGAARRSYRLRGEA